MSPVRRRSSSGPAVLVGLVLVMGAAGDQRAQAREDDEARCGEIPRLPPATTDWPRIRSEIRRDPFTEAIIAGMVSRMTRPEQVRVTGQDWAFAPTLAVVRDDRWGRTYEGFSEDPAITRAYAAAYVAGLQNAGEGEDEDRSVRRLRGVLATAKHFIGDGGTAEGRDQGVNPSSEAVLREIHGQGYFGALGAGAQTVMISFSSWTNEQLNIHEGKVHGSRYLITDVLKGKMGFDGLVVSDWNGIGQVTGCSNFRCAQALNAGIDVVMVPAEWRQFIDNTIQLVQSGAVPMSRIDDAVTRILRVKLRAGLFGARRPSERRLAGDAGNLVPRDHRREAAQP